MDMLKTTLMTVILPAAGTVLVVALCNLAAQWAKKIKNDWLREAVEALVQAAEQLYGPGKGAEKKAFVLEQAPKGVTEAMVEAAVYNEFSWGDLGGKKAAQDEPTD